MARHRQGLGGEAPGVLGGDPGELQFVPYILGLAHPTGTPLYVLVGKLWSLLPVGPTVAWRMNLLAAVAASLALVAETIAPTDAPRGGANSKASADRRVRSATAVNHRPGRPFDAFARPFDGDRSSADCQTRPLSSSRRFPNSAEVAMS